MVHRESQEPPLPGSASESQPVMRAAPPPNRPSTLRRWLSKPLPLLRSLETEETRHRLGDPLDTRTKVTKEAGRRSLSFHVSRGSLPADAFGDTAA